MGPTVDVVPACGLCELLQASSAVACPNSGPMWCAAVTFQRVTATVRECEDTGGLQVLTPVPSAFRPRFRRRRRSPCRPPRAETFPRSTFLEAVPRTR